MITYKQADEAKEKFKNLYWYNNIDAYNGILIRETFHRKQDQNGIMKTFRGDCFIKVFVFDIKTVENFPEKIDDVEIKYFEVYKKI